MTACPSCGQENPEGARFCNACGGPLAGVVEAGVRKTVTVLFCDLVGSTALGERADPEVFREVMSGYHAELRTILERHGGTVEKFVGDAAMAVFGIPRAHEDDALRAVRAAYEIQQAVGQLDLEARIGVNTGEVVAGGGETLVTGDAVNVAARLEQAAQAGEVLLGQETYALVRDAIRAEPVEPLSLKGKAEPMPAHRLLEVLANVPAFTRPIDTPFVGREHELATLERTLAHATEERLPQLATIVGPPGIGKSRLARELIQRSDARILVGRCLSYGEGITYWPLAEIVQQVGDVASIVDDELVVQRIGAALGDGMAPSEEIAWSFRRLFESLAQERPLVVVLDDIHWAEPTLLDLIEYVSAFARDAPLLLLCMARPDLFELRPAWAAPRPNATLVTLEPLAASETQTLVDELREVSEEAKARIVQAAEGNPLFVEQLVAMQAGAGNGNGKLEIPPTLQALLAARIDRLEPEERSVIERASIEGPLFHRGSVTALLPELARVGVGGHLLTLVRKEFIRPDRSQLPGDDGFRFGHILIRDAAYDSISKKLRAELHERFADWLESKLEEAPDEIVGFHLEQALCYRTELGLPDEHGREAAVRAATHLGRAGLRAFGRSDIPATVGLLGRACALLLPGAPERLRLLPELGSALGGAGRFDEARSVLDGAVEEARRAGDRAAEGRARIEQLFLRFEDAEGVTDEAEEAVQELVPLFEELGDDQALARLWRLSGFVSLVRGCLADLAAAEERALKHAHRARDEREEGFALFWITQAAVWGPTPAEQGIRQCEALLAEAAGSTSAEAGVRNGLAMLYAMVERGEEARAALRQSCQMYRELGLEVLSGAAAMHEGPVELYLGDPAAAEGGLRRAMEVLERLGERGYRSTAAAWLARALNDQGRHVEAEEATRLSEELAAADDTLSQVGWRMERARAIAHRGELEEAERLVHEAVALAEPTDGPDDKGKCAFALAEVLRLAGRNDEAAEAAAEAVEEWDRKGIVAYVEKARALLAELTVTT